MLPRNKVTETVEAVIVQYANGKSPMRTPPKQGRFLEGNTFFYSEVGKDADFDAWCEALRTPQCEVRHAGGKEVIHWHLGEHIRLFPITAGPVAPTVAQSVSPKNRAATANAGIGIKWTQGERSKLAIRGYLQVEGNVYGEPVQLTVRSKMTDELLAALVDHVRVCEIADGLIDRAKHPDAIGLWELALPLGPGAEVAWGKGDTTNVYPLQSTHADRPDLAYLRSLWRPESVKERVARDWEGVQAWAESFATAGEMVGAAE